MKKKRTMMNRGEWGIFRIIVLSPTNNVYSPIDSYLLQSTQYTCSHHLSVKLKPKLHVA